MEPITIGLMVVALGLAALSVWLFAQRANLQATIAAHGTITARYESEVKAAKQETEIARRDAKMREAELSAKYAESRNQVLEISQIRVALETELKNAEERFDQEVIAVRREAEARIQSELEKLEAERRLVKDEVVRIETRIKSLNEETRAAFTDAAQRVVSNANAEFLKLTDAKMQAQRADMEKRQVAVETLVKPIGESLQKTQEKLSEIERERATAFGKLSEQIRGVSDASSALRDQTGKLVETLKRPQVRGRYGEVQLERLVELAGMKMYADFNMQHSTRDSEGMLLRPDLIVTMSNKREIVVDAKTNIGAYLEAIESGDAEKSEACYERFAENVAQQVTALAKKQYWSQYKGSPEFVIMFVPGEQFLDAALRRRPELIDTAAEAGVILATPSTLIGLLKAVALGWREQRLEDQARDLFKIGSELHERAATAWDHLSDVGSSLHKTVDAYNSAVRSIDARLMPTLRKFEDAGAKSAKELPALPEVDVRPQTGTLF